jgi:DNA uptake protein ComE-like DNA-binding protein
VTCEADELQRFAGCTLVETNWADGDSFMVRFPNGEEHTLRLYGADCVELHVATDSDRRRLRAQCRYFGISEYGGSPRTSSDKAKELAREAARRTKEALQRKFTVDTAFADARGDGRHPRVYAFVETSDQGDLAELLVKERLARAHGIFRGRSNGATRDEYEGRLKDHELMAAKKGIGIWKFTDWNTLPQERSEERKDEAELDAAKDRKPEVPADKINPNTASRDELMLLPGVGEVIANRIIEGRQAGPYQKPDDLLRIPGLGKKRVDRIRGYLTFER